MKNLINFAIFLIVMVSSQVALTQVKFCPRLEGRILPPYRCGNPSEPEPDPIRITCVKVGPKSTKSAGRSTPPETRLVCQDQPPVNCPEGGCPPPAPGCHTEVVKPAGCALRSFDCYTNIERQSVAEGESCPTGYVVDNGSDPLLGQTCDQISDQCTP